MGGFGARQSGGKRSAALRIVVTILGMVYEEMDDKLGGIFFANKPGPDLGSCSSQPTMGTIKWAVLCVCHWPGVEFWFRGKGLCCSCMSRKCRFSVDKYKIKIWQKPHAIESILQAQVDVKSLCWLLKPLGSNLEAKLIVVWQPLDFQLEHRNKVWHLTLHLLSLASLGFFPVS